MPHNIEGYAAICREAERLGWPEAYRDGLRYHDAHVMMDDDAPQEFGFAIRKDGTDLFIPKKNEYIDLAIACRKYGTNEHYRWYRDGKLEVISVDELIVRLLKKSGRYVKGWIDEDTGKFISYAWPGGYTVIYLDAKNNTLCPDCASNNDPDFDPPIEAGFVYYEGPTLQCDNPHCQKDLPSAYGDPEEEETDE